jgi:multimeric flavodoxin WrbA
MPRVMSLGEYVPQVLIAYHSQGGNTRKMAEALAEAVRASGCEVILEEIDSATVNKLAGADGVLLGSPCCLGAMSARVKQFLDDSILGQQLHRDHLPGGHAPPEPVKN